MFILIEENKGGKKGKLSVREAGGETKIHKGGGRRTPCVPPVYYRMINGLVCFMYIFLFFQS